ncbi:glycoside hydrolase family 57 protein [Myxococcus xanthus]|uniref:glycoside hydrolase family 57 protein n=1 Tax=Myxococcus xanthus TaxID=34 RepID=UPI001126D6D4|nr:1,4-alpha-glucan branching protein domain-containing protein [Myxococcus xanthus]QDE82668.1 glycoside hydrolase [Myxococcus xanthus]QDE96938.1 glycoside hydrolase [Myxococcus xanthus]
MSLGSLALVLHAHLPFVRHPEHEDFLEEDWLYEAISETYLPLLQVFDGLAEDGVPFRLAMTLSPTLVSMLRDELLMSRYARRLDLLCELGAREAHRTRDDATFGPIARFYRDHFESLRRAFHDRYKRDLVSAFRRLQDAGYLDILTCNATHGFLPLMQQVPEAVRAQVTVAANHYRQHFGRDPAGIWLAECGYYPGLERLLASERIRYFFVDTHGLTDAVPRPLHGPYAPVFTEAGVAAYARDPESSQQVWSTEHGYPGDPDYREFYRDIGWDLDLDYIRPFIQPTGERKNTGFKYFRITGKTNDKRPYDPLAARERASVHAGNFLFNRQRQIEDLASRLGGREPVVVAPYDAELFGHWWFEGPQFLDFLIRKVAYDQKTFRLVTPSDDLRAHPENQVATPPLSSWGAGGYANMWLDGSNDWIYRHLNHCAKQMVELARDFPDAGELQRRALNQAARELLLAQSSDWAFIMKTGTMVEYAQRRTREHILRFQRLHEQLRGGSLDEGWLCHVEGRDNLYPELDYRLYLPA